MLNALVPPQNLEAEQSVLGGLLLDPDCWHNISDIVTSSDFYKTTHGKIFEAIRRLHQNSQPVDIITVTNTLRDGGDLDTIGGAAYIAELINQTPTTAHIDTYAEIIKEKSLLRRTITSCNEIIQKAYSQDIESIESFLDQAESKIFNLAENKRSANLVSVGEIVKSSITRIEELYSQKIAVTGISSGFSELDEMTSGFQPGDLIIIAARPSMGKTALSLNIAQHAALRDKKCVAYFSVEMSKEPMMMRILASESGINLSHLRVGHINDSQWPKLINTAAKVSEAQLFVDDTSGVSPFEIRARCRRLKARHGLDMIMVDYLQIMDLKQKVESRERAVSEISKNLKSIAKELQVPVIALAQLNRGVEGRSDRRPMLSDLRESGSIEQDADIIMMIYREGYYERENPDAAAHAEVIVAKQRNGPTGIVKLLWDAQTGNFRNAVHNQMAPPPATPPFRGELKNFATL